MRRQPLHALVRAFPAPPGGDEGRQRFVVTALLLAVALAVLTAPVFSLYDQTLAIVVSLFGLLAMLLLAALRFGTPAWVGFWGLQVLTALLMLAGRWTEVGFEVSWAMWLAVLPLTATAYSGTRGGLLGLALAVAAVTGMLLVADPGFLPQVPQRALGVGVRLASFLLAIFLLSLAWHSLRTDALARAEAAARSRTLFLARMSHELRTPMNGVLGLVDVLLASQPRDDQRESLELMGRSGAHLLALINDVIDFARLDTGRLPLTSEPVDLHALVSDTVELLRPAADRASLRLASRVHPDAPRWVRGDGVRLRQVLINLLGNAVKFTPRGTVEVALEPRGADFALVVSDTGIGIADEVQARLFEAFEQGGPQVAGSGLGLAISKRLVERMGGTISYSSVPGQGSVFTVSLPLEVLPAPVSARAPAGPFAPTASPLRVLVVDDNDINLRVATALLEKAGCVPTPLREGAAAVAAVRDGEFEAVLMDCHMPGMDGFEATRRIRELAGERGRVPIIALTASVLPEELERCRRAGMDDWLAKPVTLATLTSTLGRLPRR